MVVVLEKTKAGMLSGHDLWRVALGVAGVVEQRPSPCKYLVAGYQATCGQVTSCAAHIQIELRDTHCGLCFPVEGGRKICRTGPRIVLSVSRATAFCGTFYARHDPATITPPRQ